MNKIKSHHLVFPSISTFPPQPKKISLQTSMREWKVYVVKKQNILLLLRSECLHANVCCCLFILYIIYVHCVVVLSLDVDACSASERKQSFICVCLKTICLNVKKPHFTSLTFYLKRLVTLSSVFSPFPLLLFSSLSHPMPVFLFRHFLCEKRDIQHLWFTEAVMYNSGVITSLMNWPWGGPRLLITLH